MKRAPFSHAGLRRGPTILAVIALAACGPRPIAADSPAASAMPAYSLVTLERTPCFGACPVYRVTVAGDGAVEFEGRQHVDSIGRFTGRIDAASVAALTRLFDEKRYFALADRYVHGESTCPKYATDAPTVITSVTASDRVKRVEHDLGCFEVPQRLSELERGIDEIVRTSRWIGR